MQVLERLQCQCTGALPARVPPEGALRRESVTPAWDRINHPPAELGCHCAMSGFGRYLRRFVLSDLVLLAIGTVAYSLPCLAFVLSPDWTYGWLPVPDWAPHDKQSIAVILWIGVATIFLWWWRRGKTLVWTTIVAASWLLSAIPDAYETHFGQSDDFLDYPTLPGKLWLFFSFRLEVLVWCVLIGLVIAAIVHNLRPSPKDRAED